MRAITQEPAVSTLEHEIVSGNGSPPMAHGEETLEDLASQLFKQIRDSDFLERNKPQGESLFAIAAREEEKRLQQESLTTKIHDDKPAQAANNLFKRIAVAAQPTQTPAPAKLAPAQSANASGKPNFQDALQSILEDLDAVVPSTERSKTGEGSESTGQAEESFDGLVGQLFQQIRAGGLEHCEPSGESLFTIAAKQEEKRVPSGSANSLFSRISAASQPGLPATTNSSQSSQTGKPRFHDALQTILQDLEANDAGAESELVQCTGESKVAPQSAVAGGEESFEGLVGQLFQQIRAGGLEDCEPRGKFVSAGQEPQAKAGMSNVTPEASVAKPSLQDALSTILQDLDANMADGARPQQDSAAVEMDREGGELVGAFQAMAPTLEAFFKDLAGDLGGDEEGNQ